uniref:Uncharacterized protein n=1 Tax=Arundo donax TaxID=35708 RepID=A0A0A9FT92_ARUDO
MLFHKVCQTAQVIQSALSFKYYDAEQT